MHLLRFGSLDRERRKDKIGESPAFEELADKYEHRSLMRAAAEVTLPLDSSYIYVFRNLEKQAFSLIKSESNSVDFGRN